VYIGKHSVASLFVSYSCGWGETARTAARVLPRVINEYGKLVEGAVAGKTEVLVDAAFLSATVHNVSHTRCRSNELGREWREAGH
jgi:hypothetical protein